MHLLWLKEHRPDLLAPTATAMHCKDWLYLKLTGERATDPAEGTFTFGDFRRRGYAPEVLELLGASELRRLLPRSSRARASTTRSPPTPPSRPGSRPACPSCWATSTSPAPRSAAASTTRRPDVGCSVIGSTGMHMRLARGADEVRLNDAQTGYTMVFPVPGTFSQMQSNMAATLNIDWLVDRAGEILAAFGEQRPERGALAPRRPRGRGPARHAPLPPLHLRRRRARPVRRLLGPRPVRRPDHHHRLLRHGARGLRGPLPRRARLLRRHGPDPDEVRITGGAARSPTLRHLLASVLGVPVRTTLREETGAAGAAMMAAVRLGFYPDMAACCAEWIDPFLGALEEPDPALARRYDALFPVYQSGHRAMPEVWRGLARARQEGLGHA
jgi:erythritol kinase